MKKIILVVSAIFTVILLTGCGGSDNTTSVPVPAPTTTVTVEKQVEVPVKVEVTPAACHTFIKDSDRLVKLEADAISLAGDALIAASQLDSEEIMKINAKIEKLSPKIVKARSKYESSRDRCASA